MARTPDELEIELVARRAFQDLDIKHADSLEIIRQKLNWRFLPHVDVRSLHRRITQFRKLNFRSMSYGDVSQAIRDVIIFNTPNGPCSVLQVSTGPYPAGTLFYRVRTIPRDDHVTPLRSMSKVSDCWEPPKKLVKMGRLNKDGEPILYTSPSDPRVAIGELKIPDHEWFSLIVYEAVEDVNVAMIGGDVDVEGLDDVDALKIEMIQGFLRDEFTRDVGRGTEYLYRISEIIAKDYFDMPPVMQDAWCYPSIVDKSKFNVAFRPKTRTKLRLIGVEMAKVYRMENGEAALQMSWIAAETEGRGDLSYFEIDSPEQRRLFPWITQNRPDSVRTATGTGRG